MCANGFVGKYVGQNICYMSSFDLLKHFCRMAHDEAGLDYEIAEKKDNNGETYYVVAIGGMNGIQMEFDANGKFEG